MKDFDRILKSVSECEAVSIEDIMSRSRRRDIIEARQMIIYFARQNTNLTLQWIADYFNMDHSTIVYSERHIKELAEHDMSIQLRLKRIHKWLSIEYRMAEIDRAVTAKTEDIQRIIDSMSNELSQRIKIIIDGYNKKVIEILKNEKP